MNPMRIAIISEQKLICSALKAMLMDKVQIFICVECLDDFWLRQIEDIDIILVDASLDLKYIDEIKIICKQFGVYMVLISQLKNRLLELLSVKADGYLTTDISLEEFIDLLNDVKLGKPALASTVLKDILLNFQQGASAHGNINNVLTVREKEILLLLAKGYSNQKIASNLCISIYTVKNHIHHILEKLHINNRVELASYAIYNGLVS